MRLAVPLLLLPFLPAVMLCGATGEDGKQGKATPLDQFMEEVRGALAGHWELLQNLRYHTLSIKARLVQLEAQIQNLSENLGAAGSSQDADSLLQNKRSCEEEEDVNGEVDVARDAERREGDDEMQDLLDAMRNLTQVYSTLAATNRLCGKLDLADDGKASLDPYATAITMASADQEAKQEEETGIGHIFITAQLGSTAVLTCHLDNLQDPDQVAWIRVRDQNWLSQGRHKVAASENRISVGFSDEELRYYRLFLEDVRSEDEGAYECHLSTAPVVAQTIWLTVTDPPPSPPLLKQLPLDTSAVEGQDVTLNCKMSGYPEPSITWTRNRLQVSSSARHQITPAGDLIIRGVRRGDAGRYVCRGVNSVGEEESGALLTVRLSTRIVRPPRDKERLVGDSVVLRCRADGDEGSLVLVEWLKDDVLIDFSTGASSSSRFSRRPNNALVVNSLQLEDSGVYTCRASTPFHTASASAILAVSQGAVASIATTTSTSTTIIHVDYCPPPYERIYKHVCILEITHVKLSWEDAAEHCRLEGGQLAWEIEGKLVLQEFLEERYGLGWSTTSTNTRWPFWVGGRESDDGEWQWLDGSPVPAGAWAVQHRRPSGRRTAKEDWCLMLDGYQGYLATALPCHSKRYFLCRLK